GNPGLGKTSLVKALAGELGLDWNRIQFTPDLMPADITGTVMPDLKNLGGESFKPGPIFASLLLADELNRASPKTQSAMLEGMGEGHVTVLGKTYRLPGGERIEPGQGDRDPKPFMVLATQNPIDQEGTYSLPEAQQDRFMFKILMPTPDAGTLREIMEGSDGQGRCRRCRRSSIAA
ncbi:MAG: AAA domain-containing protein, partial [bacterium]|nr:AAA domain-containing protein [bacterium]